MRPRSFARLLVLAALGSATACALIADLGDRPEAEGPGNGPGADGTSPDGSNPDGTSPDGTTGDDDDDPFADAAPAKLDPQFGDAGLVILPIEGSYAYAVVADDRGIVVAGTRASGLDSLLLRLDRTGNYDSSFGDAGIAGLNGPPRNGLLGVARVDGGGGSYLATGFNFAVRRVSLAGKDGADGYAEADAAIRDVTDDGQRGVGDAKGMLQFFDLSAPAPTKIYERPTSQGFRVTAYGNGWLVGGADVGTNGGNVVLARFANDASVPDPAFGEGGTYTAAVTAAIGTAREKAMGIAALANGDIAFCFSPKGVDSSDGRIDRLSSEGKLLGTTELPFNPGRCVADDRGRLILVGQRVVGQDGKERRFVVARYLQKGTSFVADPKFGEAGQLRFAGDTANAIATGVALDGEGIVAAGSVVQGTNPGGFAGVSVMVVRVLR